MSTPVIDPESSVLSYPQWLTWAHQFSATYTPYDWQIVAGNFPPGMSFQPSWSVTTSGGSIVFTSPPTDQPFDDGACLVFRSLGGSGAGLAPNVPYYVINMNWSEHTFQLSATPGGSAISITSDYSGSLLYQPGYLAGAANTPGIFTVQLVATNGTPSTAVLWTIGIEPAAAVPDSNADIVWDFATNNIIVQTSSALNLTPADRATPVLFVKEEDDLITRLRLVKNGTLLDLGAPTDLKLVLKESEPENQVVISDANDYTGPGSGASYLVHAKFDGTALAASLSNYEADTGTFYNALAEFELTFTNPGYFASTPATLRRTSKTFAIQIERDLGEN